MRKDAVSDETFADFYATGWNGIENGNEDHISTQAAIGLELRTHFPQFVLFEDEDLLILNKPAGINSNRNNPSQLGILEVAQDSRREDDLMGVNRLDGVTSGAIVFAKNNLAFNSLREQFGNKEQLDMRKMYLALLDGHFHDSSTIEVNTHITPAGRHPLRMRLSSPHDSSAREATTYFTPLALYQDPTIPDSLMTLTQIRIMTGRTHQIRISAAQALGPTIKGISGDPIYNRGSQDVSRTMLHSYEIGFRHPRTQELHRVIANPPTDFMQNLAGLRLLRLYQG